MGELLWHPALPLLIGAVVVRLASRRVGDVVMVAAPIAALAAIWQLPTGTVVEASYLGFELTVLRADALTLPFTLVFAVAAVLAGTFGMTTMGARERSAALVYVAAAMAVVLAGDLMTLFIAWEVKAVASTLVILARGAGPSGRAGLRYLFAHLVGGKLLLAGVLWHLADTGSLAFEAMTLTPATTLILVGVLLSAAVPPLHAWLADAYPAASVAGTVFLSAFTTKAAVYALVRGFPGTEVLIYLGIAMAAYGVIYAMLQQDTRRLLSYHIISQVGFMVTAVGIGTDLALNGAVAHAVAHIIYKGLLLMGVGALLHATGRSKIAELGGLANRTRAVLALYLVGAVSISSVPLFSGFVSKELVVAAASGAELAWLVIALKVVSVGTFLSTGLKLPWTTWYGAEGAGPTSNEGARIEVRPVPASMYLAMGLAAAINLGLGVVPAPLYDVLPYPLDYTPYSLAKVVEKLQLLGFTVLGFWLLRDRMAPARKVMLDLDRLYRTLPGRLARAAAPGTTDTPVAAGAAEPGPVTATVERVRTALTPVDAPAPVVPTWVLGAILLGGGALVLAVSLLGGVGG